MGGTHPMEHEPDKLSVALGLLEAGLPAEEMRLDQPIHLAE